jgi:hypothetical protein
MKAFRDPMAPLLIQEANWDLMGSLSSVFLNPGPGARVTFLLQAISGTRTMDSEMGRSQCKFQWR